MSDFFNYETYILISSDKFIISVYSNDNKKVYEEKLIFDDISIQINFEKLDYFLNENIFRIEKKINTFVKKTLIIFDLDIFFPLEIAVKKNNYENNFTLDNLNHTLNDIRDYCKKTTYGKKIVHMIINNYDVDDKNYPFFPEGIKSNNFSLDLKLICISLNLIKDLEKIFKKYQISISQIVSAKYIENFMPHDEKDIFLMAKKIINGHNPNEVLLVNKTPKNKGFFEKIFHFFS
tara:strand:- start:256 stop:957 length:702 start_codon:yes stop_codon:yes gene_type:complete